MIEALVDYIEQKGYTAHVGKWHILIDKRVGDELVCAYGWGIAPIYLEQRNVPKEFWFREVDHYCALIEREIDRLSKL